MQVGHHLLCEQCNSHTIGNRGVAAMTARIPRIYSWEYVNKICDGIAEGDADVMFVDYTNHNFSEE